MALYHIHKSNRYDDLYHVGNTIEVGKVPNSFRTDFLNGSCSYVAQSKEEDGKTIMYRDSIVKLFDEEIVSTLNEYNILQYLNILKACIVNSSIDIRELILEEVRKNNFPTLPSRYSCMWLSDEESLESWIAKLKCEGRDYSIYEVETDGNLFLTTSTLLPVVFHAHNMMYDEALRYWNPTEEDLIPDKREYLFEGKVKLKRRVI